MDDGAVTDVITVIGGMCSPDHLGPERHRELVQRVRAQPNRYLMVFKQLVLRPGVDPLDLADLHPGELLKLLADREPQAVRETRERLAALYASAIGGIETQLGVDDEDGEEEEEKEVDETSRRRRRLQEHLATLDTAPRESSTFAVA